MGRQVRIDHLGAQGDGVVSAPGDGETEYLPFTLPGETVEIGAAGSGDASLRVLTPSPARRPPPCRHFGVCGGCALQHASDDLVAEWKAGLVSAALGARGILDVPLRPMVTAPAGARRRIAPGARRTKREVRIGFHAAASSEVVPVVECPVAAPDLVAAMPELAPLVRLGASRKGEIGLTMTTSAAGIDLAVTGGKPLAELDYAALVATVGRRIARLSWDGEPVVTRAPPLQPIGRAQVLPPPGGFLQPTRVGEAALQSAVVEILGPARRVADLFAGCGTFALVLAERAEVLAVEGDAAALSALDAAWRATPGLRKVATVVRDLARRPLVGPELRGLDGLVMDPPRAGARAQAEVLAAEGPHRIASVSCNPATFARDARILIDGGYRLDWIQPVDQFRWSPHLELVGAFRR